MSDSGIIYNVFFLLGGIAVLLFGIKAIGSNLQKATGGNLKKMFKNLTGNRFAGVGAGAVVTAILQSSTATTVMLVGFVNIGVMTLSQAAAVIMGANVGTTVTAQVMSLTGLSFDISAIAAFIGALGMFTTMVAKKEILKRIGQVLLGLGMIFIGLKIMTNSVDYIVYDRVGGEKVLSFFCRVGNSALSVLFGGLFHLSFIRRVFGILFVTFFVGSSHLLYLQRVFVVLFVIFFVGSSYLLYLQRI